jgi:hypothetical protein
MVRLLFERVVTPGTAAAGHVLWYLSYHASGGSAARADGPSHAAPR